MNDDRLAALEEIELRAWRAYRRRGAHGALIAHRIEEAARLGAETAVVETGEYVPDRPSHSYRNLLRYGFKEIHLRQNYLSPAGPARD